MDDRIPIIVSTSKRDEQLKRYLESFSRLRCSCSPEFVIVDNDSCDGIVQFSVSYTDPEGE